jgi:hypothetical protein
VPATTYPGTVTPLRGLNAFAESERDVLFGRDGERDDLARLVSAEGFRAGLLYGESGVGKSSLLRAGLVPHLRDHGVVALLCEDIFHPEESFARALGRVTGSVRGASEQPVQFLGRVLADAVGQIFLFIVDEADIALSGARHAGGGAVGGADDRVVSELGELFARVVARSGGRARFLFACASERLHVFGALERRTGSLFPPSTRYELPRFQLEQAAFVLERTLALAGASADPQLSRAVAVGLARDGGPILPADLQIAALAVVQFGVTTPAALDKLGGTRELEAQWLRRAAAATGDERAALRLLSELAQPAGASPSPPQSVEVAAARASVDADFARRALAVLQDKGITRAVAAPGEGDVQHHTLAHEVMAARVREVAAPARASARRAFELLGSKAARERRLGLRDWYEVWREGLSPSTPAERAVIDRTRRFATIALAAAVGVPIALLVVIWVSLSGRYYIDAAGGDDGAERAVVRKGRAGLSAFHWLPGGFGDVEADTGFTRAMIDPEAWSRVTGRELGGELDGGAFARQAFSLLRPGLRGLVEYAATGSETALDGLVKAARTPDDVAALLAGLQPIARGVPQEVSLVETALADVSPAVQSSALALAASAERRRPGLYRATLARALTSKSAELRRLSVAAVRALPEDAARALLKESLALAGTAPEVRSELGGLLAAADSGAAAPTASSALALLAQASAARPAGDKENGKRGKNGKRATDKADDRSAQAEARERGRELLRRAFAGAPAEAAAASARLVADEGAPPDDRVFAIGLLLEMAPPASFKELVEPAKLARDSNTEAVREAALPLYARVAPQEASGDLALMLKNEALSPGMKVAMALAWGEVAARGKNKAAQGALETLIKDPSLKVRAAAAEAYGSVGRIAQSTLAKMIKGERSEVALGAATGLARSVEAGGSTSSAMSGLHQLWKQKGRQRRDAARLYARVARTRPNAVVGLLSTASRSDEDPALHPIGVDGLCNAMAAGERDAISELSKTARAGSAEVRRLVMQCLSDNPKLLAPAARIALEMTADPDRQNRAEAARLVAALAAGSKVKGDVGEALARMARDDDREVRIIAIRALAGLGDAAPRQARESLPRAYDGADETERLVILEAAREIGAGELARIGMADPSPLVRVAALETAIATRTDVATMVQSALSDPDATVRRAAVERLAAGGHGLTAEDVDRALALAVRDRDESLRVLALATLARLGEPGQVAERLRRMLASPSERERARAAQAARGLAERDPKSAIALLEPLYRDPSRDVRAAMMESLATAYATSRKPDELAAMLNASETAPTRRLVVTAAFLLRAGDPDTRDDAVAGLEKAIAEGPPLAKLIGRLGLGLISSSADGLAFLAELIP